MPLEARRDELADYVGQGDADQTPESVLAMVQPVIMMTEEGAMNSGIGNLMQQLTGDIDMMTEGGQPTDMGQGVGSLTMAGAPEALLHKILDKAVLFKSSKQVVPPRLS